MKYFVQAEEKLFFNFVFYEVEDKIMYVYCPNCQRVHEIKIKTSVKDIKENIFPCECFQLKGIPKYLKTCHEYYGLNRSMFVAEFEKNENNEAILNVYNIVANFSAHNYDCQRPFKRYPVFNETLVCKFTFANDFKVKMEGKIIQNMSAICFTHWHNYKSWNQCFDFTIIDESLEEVKGTSLEQFTNYVNDFTEIYSTRINQSITYLDEVFFAWLKTMYSNIACQKLWKAGYKKLVMDKVFNLINKNYYSYDYSTISDINFRGKCLESILKVQPQKLDLISDRETCSGNDVRACYYIDKYNLSYNVQNKNIVLNYRFLELAKTLKSHNFSVAKGVKYIKNQSNKSNRRSCSSLIMDYYDYLETLIKLGTKLTPDVVFPTNLIKAHDKTAQIYKIVKDKKAQQSFNKIMKKYLDLNQTTKRYKIMAIKSLSQLQKYASSLHNCAATYDSKIIDGTSVIFVIFDNKNPKIPYSMLELNPITVNIIQNRSAYNNDVSKYVKKYTNTWFEKKVIPFFKKVA